MEPKRALREAVRYNVAALGPTLVGGAIAVVGLWLGALEPFVRTAGEHGVGTILAGEAGFRIDLLVVLVTVGVGFGIHRVGRTALLFAFYAEVLRSEFEQEPGE